MKGPYVFALALLLAACGSQPKQAAELAALPTPFPMADGAFTGAPQDFLLNAGLLGLDYTAADLATESPNSRVVELRPDGQAYIDATGRRSGWQVQFNRSAGSGPTYIVNVVNIYENLEGPHLTLSREWHAQVWDRIDSGELVLLPEIEGLVSEHLVWQDASGTIGVEIAYRNLYIFMTGPTDSGDQYEYFANLAKAYIGWVKAGEEIINR